METLESYSTPDNVFKEKIEKAKEGIIQWFKDLKMKYYTITDVKCIYNGISYIITKVVCYQLNLIMVIDMEGEVYTCDMKSGILDLLEIKDQDKRLFIATMILSD